MTPLKLSPNPSAEYQNKTSLKVSCWYSTKWGPQTIAKLVCNLINSWDYQGNSERVTHKCIHMRLSINGATPKSSILIGFSTQKNHRAIGVLPTRNLHTWQINRVTRCMVYNIDRGNVVVSFKMSQSMLRSTAKPWWLWWNFCWENIPSISHNISRYIPKKSPVKSPYFLRATCDIVTMKDPKYGYIYPKIMKNM